MMRMRPSEVGGGATAALRINPGVALASSHWLHSWPEQAVPRGMASLFFSARACAAHRCPPPAGRVAHLRRAVGRDLRSGHERTVEVPEHERIQDMRVGMELCDPQVGARASIATWTEATHFHRRVEDVPVAAGFERATSTIAATPLPKRDPAPGRRPGHRPRGAAATARAGLAPARLSTTSVSNSSTFGWSISVDRQNRLPLLLTNRLDGRSVTRARAWSRVAPTARCNVADIRQSAARCLRA